MTRIGIRRGAVLSLLCVTQAVLAGQQVTVEFTGRLLPGTCNLQVASTRQQIQLPDVRARDFSTDRAQGRTPFSITATDCAAVRRVSFHFSGSADEDDPTRWRNQGNAGNVAVWLRSIDGQTLCNQGPECSTSLMRPVLDGRARVDLAAAYWRVLPGPVTGGEVRATIAVTLTYE